MWHYAKRGLDNRLISFINTMLRRIEPRRILLCAENHETFRSIEESFKNDTEVDYCTGHEINKENNKINVTFSSNIPKQYDTILSFPAFGNTDGYLNIKNRCPKKRIPREIEEIENLSGLIDKNGKLICFLPSRYRKHKDNQFLEMLRKRNLNVGASFSVPKGMIPEMSEGFLCFIIESEKKQKIFISQIPEHQKVQEAIISKYLTDIEYKQGVYTFWIEQGENLDVKYHEQQQHIRSMASQKGYTFTPFNNLVNEIRKSKYSKDAFQRLPEVPNAIYLPEMGLSEVTTSQEDLSPKLKSYYQILLNDDLINPDYFAYWLNSAMGKIWRESFLSETVIPRIDIKNMKDSEVPVLPFEMQMKIAQAHGKIEKTKERLKALEEAIDNTPSKLDEIIITLGKYDYSETLDYWISQLPFPLSSVLRAYQNIDENAKEKYLRLLHFFEAAAIFLACIHLSAYKSNSEMWNKLLIELREKLSEAKKSFARPDFGTWNTVHGHIASNTQKALLMEGDKNIVEKYKSMYATIDVSILERICSKRIRQVLEMANKYRNEWAGHAGNVSEETATERLKILEDLLNEFRLSITDVFTRYQLVQLDRADTSGGILNYKNSYDLTGSDPLFKRIDITLRDIYDSKFLYIHEVNNFGALRLLSFIVIKKDKMHTDCYFYNRLTDGKPYLITYHMASQDDILISTGEINQLVEELRDYKR